MSVSEAPAVFGASRRGEFDFPALPSGSHGFYAANGRHAVRLTREGKELESVLREEWAELGTADPVTLASLVLRFYDKGIRATHHVLSDATGLRQFAASSGSLTYVLRSKEIARVETEIGKTHINRGDEVQVRAVTICGWMHEKQNLGVERFSVTSGGRVTLEPRQVLSRKIFSKTPDLRY